jgi:hypothetical protein
MMGSVAKPIESLVKIANNSINTDLQVPEIRIVCLLTIAHLSRLLIQSSNSLELLEPMKNGTSFYEELVIAAAVSANEQKFPIQVMSLHGPIMYHFSNDSGRNSLFTAI